MHPAAALPTGLAGSTLMVQGDSWCWQCLLVLRLIFETQQCIS